MVMMDFLKGVFEENYNVDDREPLASFQIPNVEGDFSLFAPSLGPWKQQLIFSFLQSIIQIVFACFIYEAIVKRRGTIGSYIIGWGFVIPISIYLPFYLLEVLDLRYVQSGTTNFEMTTIVYTANNLTDIIPTSFRQIVFLLP
jgi:hypothetical protein